MTDTTITTSYICVKQSDLYPASHFRSGLFFSALTLMAAYFFPVNWEDPIWLVYIEVAAFFVGYLLAYTKKLKKFFTFRSEMKEEVHQKALESLKEYGLLNKESHIFLFASAVEKRIECILSTDLEERITPDTVRTILKNNKQQLKEGSLATAMQAIIEEIKSHFPTATPKTEEKDSPQLVQPESAESLLPTGPTAENTHHSKENQTTSE